MNVFVDDLEKVEISHLAIGAHQDDLEIMAAHGIKECYNSDVQYFAGVTVTDGRGSSRTGEYAGFTDEQMAELRKKEQVDAAKIGNYAFVEQLGFASAEIKNQKNLQLTDSLASIVKKYRPKVIYTHNLLDKHQTHVAVVAHVVAALRKANYLPERFLGCEVWRSLDWLPDDQKQVLCIDGFEQEVGNLIAVFRSQTVGGKRYDLATLGRMRANATFFESHNTDAMTLAWYATDLMPLLRDKNLTLSAYVKDLVNRFSDACISSVSVQE